MGKFIRQICLLIAVLAFSEVASYAQSILEPGVGYVARQYVKQGNMFGISGPEYHSVEITIYEDGSASGIYSVGLHDYDEEGSYKVNLTGRWKNISKYDQQVIDIFLKYKDDSNYESFHIYVDSAQKAFLRDLNNSPAQLYKKTDLAAETREERARKDIVVDSDFRIFKHTSFYISGKKVPITGVWKPTEISKYDIMCVYSDVFNGDTYYFIICNEEQCNVWLNSLQGMKELFSKNDQIAKENGVTSDIRKNVSDKFSFDGLYGVGITSYSTYGWIVEQYSGRGYEYCISVLYKYSQGQSSMELHLGDYYLGKSRLIWTFKSLDDFDNIINAFNWSNFMTSFNHQVREYEEQQRVANAEAERIKREEALFD